MRQAIAEALAAMRAGEVPIGAVVVHRPSGRIIGRGHNLRENRGDPTAHAEMLALRAAARWIGHWRLDDCLLVVTLEPCPMCAGALVNARLGELAWGCDDPKAGAVRTLYQLCQDTRLNHRLPATGGILAARCAGLLRGFFKRRRQGHIFPVARRR